ncbi:ABC transporter permease subunit [Clostridium tertium]|uniref:L-arabinose transport system permease protein AraQ n=1 Tax=Clostridium tertium TaxID=1559 RepID=A0A6N3AZZ5_9CLOT
MTEQQKIEYLVEKSKKNKSGKTVALTILKHGILMLVAISMILPFLWMISTSLKTNSNVFVVPPQWIPDPIVLENYPLVFEKVPFLRYFLNTAFVAFFKLLGEVGVSALVAYGFARFNFKGKKILFMFLLATIMLPGESTLVPSFIFWSHLGFIDTYVPLILPAFGGQAVFIFFLVQYFTSIPKDFYEAAYISGANSFKIFWKIYVPMSIPALISVSIWSFMGSWNDLLAPLIYINDQMKFTIQIGLAMFQGMFEVNWPLLMAATTLSLIPVILLFFSLQKYFVQSNKGDGIK